MPAVVTNLCHMLSEAAETSGRIIPRILKKKVENHPSGCSHPFPQHVWTKAPDPRHNSDDQWTHVVSLFEEAANLHLLGAEGIAWYELIRKALDGVYMDQSPELT